MRSNRSPGPRVVGSTGPTVIRPKGPRVHGPRGLREERPNGAMAQGSMGPTFRGPRGPRAQVNVATKRNKSGRSVPPVGPSDRSVGRSAPPVGRSVSRSVGRSLRSVGRSAGRSPLLSRPGGPGPKPFKQNYPNTIRRTRIDLSVENNPPTFDPFRVWGICIRFTLGCFGVLPTPIVPIIAWRFAKGL